MNRAERRNAKKQAKRKAAAPRRHFDLPINIRFSEKEETDLMLAPTVCLENMRAGVGTEQDWHGLTLRLNWARLLNKANFHGGEEEIAAAQADLLAIKQRGWKVEADEYERIHTALVLCNQMQKASTRRELRQSLRATFLANEYKQKIRAIKDSIETPTYESIPSALAH